MKYSDFISINENFNPVFDLENESDKNWASFIPNEKFRNVLNSVIDNLNPQTQKNPVWLQGTYGTGKSHATSVIKHLLCDEDIPDYFDLEDNQLSSKLETFKQNNKVFPVVIKGTSTISTPERFKATVQSAVKKALKENNFQINVSSDFENMIDLCNKGILDIIEEDIKNSKLSFFDKSEIIPRLKDEDSDILIELEDILLKTNISLFEQENIVKWLIEVKKELKKEYDIDYLMIFWDEFTNALSLINAQDILLEIQNIAEEKNNGLSLFIVSHKTRSTDEGNEERLNKIMDRFERIYYSMEQKTTYELMAKSIEKTDENKWLVAKNRFINTVDSLMDTISSNGNLNVKKALENLYPVHPYTAYLATFIAREIGSTERSIFKFLHDDKEYGFKKFINTFEIDERYFLTSEYLWDFFLDDFQNREDEKILSVVKKYQLHYEELSALDNEFLAVFKVVLLLNILYKIAQVNEGSLAIPSRKNINNVFIGSIYEDKVDDVLNYIEQNNIINETPGHYFELTTNALPSDEISNTINHIKNTYKLNDYLNKSHMDSIKENISGKVIRETEIHIQEANLSHENILISRLEKGLFANEGYLHILLFLCKNINESNRIHDYIESINKKDKSLLKDIVVIVSEATLTEKELKDYYSFKARAIVAENHKYSEDVEINNSNAEKRMSQWVQKINTGIITWYLNDEMNHSEIKPFAMNTLNDKLTKKIFKYGFENIEGATANRNLWKFKKTAKAISEKFISPNSLEELQRTVTGAEAKSINILRDNNNEFIVNEDLTLKDSIPQDHPIRVISDFIDSRLDDAQRKGRFNIGIELADLISSPYGLYSCNINVAAFSFSLRKYVNKIYDITGSSLNDTKMKNLVVNMFEYWRSGKKENELYVRFGSIIEKQLGELINEIFELKIDSTSLSIDTVKWSLRNWIKNKKVPLWLFKYSDLAKNNENINTAIDALSNFLKHIDGNSEKIIEDCYEKLYSVQFDFKLLIKETDGDLFKNYVLSLNDCLSEDDVPLVMDTLYDVMQEEIYDWDKNKVANEVYKWIIEPVRDKEKLKELISLINDLFDLEIDSNSSLDSLKSGINGWIDSNQSPLWLFKYSGLVDVGYLDNAIESLLDLLNGKEDISKYVNDLSLVKSELRDVLKSLDGLFERYVSHINKDISNDDVNLIINYLFSELSDEVYKWEEKLIENEIYKWILISKEKKNKKLEKELINTVVDIFDLNEKYDSLDSLKSGINGWIDSNQSPLWLFKYSNIVDVSYLDIAINHLSDLLKNSGNNIDFKEYLNILNSVSSDFKLVITDDSEKLFNKFILSLSDDISQDNVSEIFDYICDNVSEHFYNWNKSDVENAVYKWLINVKPEPIPVPEPDVIDKVKRIPSTDLKDLTIRLLEENQEVQSLFARYLEGFNNE